MASSNGAITKRREAERDRIFEGSSQRVWSRKGSKGFTTVPRVMPLVCAIMDHLSRGQPLSDVYRDLWFRAYDEMYLVVESPEERAFYAGFGGLRAVTTWTTRMRKLVELGFIEVVAGTRGEFHHVLLVSPYLAVERIEKAHAKSKRADPDLAKLFDAYHQRLREVGAVS